MHRGTLPPIQSHRVPASKPQRTSWIQRARAFVERHRILSIVCSGILLITLTGGLAWYFIDSAPRPVANTVKSAPPKPKPVIYYSPLTGLQVTTEAVTHQAVTGIMIENSPDARPQSGLKDAGIVYEAIAEGGITRFLALYQEAKPALIGPVRSVREYYVDWVTPYQASVAHVGGSRSALKLVRNGTYRDIDQFFNGGSYWRASDRYAPHNVYTNFERLDALNQSKGYTTSTFASWPRVDGKASNTPTATDIAINISSSLYNTRYVYDAKTNTYTRYLGGAVHIDREKGAITPSVVVAMHVEMHKIMEDGYREHITTIGSGKATLFQNGVAQEITWQKKTRDAQIEFLDKDGKQLALTRGQTWIAAVPNGSGSVSW